MIQIYSMFKTVTYSKRILIYSKRILNLTGPKAKLFFERIRERT